MLYELMSDFDSGIFFAAKFFLSPMLNGDLDTFEWKNRIYDLFNFPLNTLKVNKKSPNLSYSMKFVDTNFILLANHSQYHKYINRCKCTFLELHCKYLPSFKIATSGSNS